MHPQFGTIKTSPEWKIAIVRALWHDELTSALSTDAQSALIAAGIPADNIITIDAPGSFEVPFLAQSAIEDFGVNGVIAFGVILQGETHHAALLAESVTHALMDLQMRSCVPVTCDILYVDTLADAKARCTGPKAKGALAAHTLLTTLAKLAELRC